jgi:hypothetical protein
MALAVGARRGADAGHHDFHVQRHLRRRLVVLVLYARERLGMGALGFGLPSSSW